METVVGLNLNHHDTCLFTKSAGGEGLFEFIQFITQTLHDAEQLIALRLEDRRSRTSRNSRIGLTDGLEEYQYVTMSAYSPTLSDLPILKSEFEAHAHQPGHPTDTV